jgi:hypothetical protein
VGGVFVVLRKIGLVGVVGFCFLGVVGFGDDVYGYDCPNDGNYSCGYVAPELGSAITGAQDYKVLIGKYVSPYSPPLLLPDLSGSEEYIVKVQKYTSPYVAPNLNSIGSGSEEYIIKVSEYISPYVAPNLNSIGSKVEDYVIRVAEYVSPYGPPKLVGSMVQDYRIIVVEAMLSLGVSGGGVNIEAAAGKLSAGYVTATIGHVASGYRLSVSADETDLVCVDDDSERLLVIDDDGEIGAGKWGVGASAEIGTVNNWLSVPLVGGKLIAQSSNSSLTPSVQYVYVGVKPDYSNAPCAYEGEIILTLSPDLGG